MNPVDILLQAWLQTERPSNFGNAPPSEATFFVQSQTQERGGVSLPSLVVFSLGGGDQARGSSGRITPAATENFNVEMRGPAEQMRFTSVELYKRLRQMMDSFRVNLLDTSEGRLVAWSLAADLLNADITAAGGNDGFLRRTALVSLRVR